MKMVSKAIMDLQEEINRATEFIPQWDKLADEFIAEEVGLQNVSFSCGSPTFQVTGGRANLNKMINVLRRHKFDSADRPQEKESWYRAFWETEDKCKVYVQFSSTQCKRVKIGEKLEVVPVYEIVCDEEPVPDLKAVG